MEVLYAVLYGDALMWLENQVKPYEKIKGQTDQVIDDILNDLVEYFNNNRYRKSKQIYKYMNPTL